MTSIRVETVKTSLAPTLRTLDDYACHGVDRVNDKVNLTFHPESGACPIHNSTFKIVALSRLQEICVIFSLKIYYFKLWLAHFCYNNKRVNYKNKTLFNLEKWKKNFHIIEKNIGIKGTVVNQTCYSTNIRKVDIYVFSPFGEQI